MRGFFDKVSHTLEKVIQKHYSLELEYPLWEQPHKQGFGDLSSTVAMRLASKLKKNPQVIASEIKTYLEKYLAADVDKIEVIKPGFINLFISSKILTDSLNKIIKTGDKFFSSKENKKVIIEFLSANPTGPLSIAHGRQAIVGDTIANILEFLGNKVTREYYLNDAGRQIKLIADDVHEFLAPTRGKEIDFSKINYKGEYLREIADMAQGELASKDLNEYSEQSNREEFVIKYVLQNYIKKDLDALGIKFDTWFSQKKLIDKKLVEKTISTLGKKGLMYEKDGALWFSSTKFGDDKDRVIKKADGELTYFASDIAYHKDKIGRKFDELINLWGPDHHGYIKRVKTSIQALGYSQDLLKIIIVQLVTLTTKERMSKRAGTFVRLSELTEDLGKDATRFYYLTRRNSSHLEFDIDLAKKTSFDNPLYYIQYVCARIESIFKKAPKASFNTKFSILLKEEEELNLLRALLQFTYCLEKARSSLEPVFVIEYLKSLASSFHKFYEKVRVIDEDKDLTQARLNLLKGVKTVFHCGLGLLGITPVEKM